MQNNANEMAVFNTAIYVRLSKEDIVAAQSGRESNSITNQKQLILDFLKDQVRGRKRPVPFRKRVYQFRKVYPPSISCFRGALNRYQ